MKSVGPKLDNALKRSCLGLTKRLLLSAVFVFPAFASASLTSAAAQTAAAQRKSVTDLSAAEVMSLRRGVAKMKSRDNAPRDSADYRRSWVYWANVHGHFGDDCAGPVDPSGPGSGMDGITTITATNDAENATWCKCEHGTNQFLTWHRMYLWYFERVLQDAAGDTSLRLPYWDYETDAHLPTAYRDKTYVDDSGNTVPNPLRVEARQPGLNDGRASLLPGVTSTDDAMSATDYGPFNDSIQDTPHGAVHCSIVTGGCPNGLMGSVPVSANDPVFYAHHTNIDRLYECWLGSDQSKLPSDQDQLNATYTFVDNDGSTPQRRVGDMLTTTQLQYSYAAGGGCPPAAVALAPAARSPVTLAAGQALATAGATRLGPTATTVPLAASPSPQGVAPQPGAAAGRTFLEIDGLKFDRAPGGLYNVYLQGPGGERQHVGVINFFNLAPSGAGVHAGHAGHASKTEKKFRFDVTDAVKKLNLGGNAQPSLVFEPTAGLAAPQGLAPESVAPKMNAEANVRFDSARLVSSP